MASSSSMASGGYYNKKGEFIFGPMPAKMQRKVENEQKQLQKEKDHDPFKGLLDDDEDAVDDLGDDVGGGVTEECLFGGDSALGGSSGKSNNLPPPPSDSEDEKQDQATKDKMDDLFASLMGNINSMPTQRQKANVKKYSSAEDLIARILDRARSSFEILGVTPEAETAEITKTYRNISRIIHPDKCRVERAHDAFQKLLEAYNELKEGKVKERYAEIWDKVRADLLKEREKHNDEKLKAGDTENLLATEGFEFDEAVISACEDKLEKKESGEAEVADYAHQVKKANEERIKARLDEEKEAKRKQQQQEQRWKKGMDKRVAGWQTFQENISAKRFKSESFAKVGQLGAADRFHKREQKTAAQLAEEQKNFTEGGQKRKAAGVDDQFKHHWR